MTDLELTKACAEKMGLQPLQRPLHCFWPVPKHPESAIRVSPGKKAAFWYDPLHNDDQVMAMVKNFRLYQHPKGLLKDTTWIVSYPWGVKAILVESDSLNRAICECVAKL